MRVAWDLQAVTGPKPTGLGVSVRFLLSAVQRFAADVDVVELRPNDENRALIGVLDRLKWEQWRLPWQLATEHRDAPLDLLYSPALGAPLSTRVPRVAHVHDLIPLYYPKQFRGFAGWYWRRLLPATWRRCQALTVSNDTVADDIAERLKYPREQIHVVPYYPDPEMAEIAKSLVPQYRDLASRKEPAAPTFLTLASHEPRKNIDLAIKALAWLKERRVAAKLLCIGLRTHHTFELQQLAERLKVGRDVEFTDYQSRRGVVWNMLHCTALLFVSRYEGFGLPPLEAQSVGCAVVLSDLPCHRRIYADPVRLKPLPAEIRCAPALIGPDDPQGLAAEMRKLIEDRDYRFKLCRAGLAYSATYTPQATASAMSEAYRAALKPAGR